MNYLHNADGSMALSAREAGTVMRLVESKCINTIERIPRSVDIQCGYPSATYRAHVMDQPVHVSEAAWEQWGRQLNRLHPDQRQIFNNEVKVTRLEADALLVQLVHIW